MHGRSADATALLGNKSIEWLHRPEISGAQSEGRPFFLYFAPHCPHTPAYPADWYRDACEGVTSPRIPNYNYSAPGFHELVARQPPLTHDDEILIDDLARRRCQCLMSVDDAHAGIVEATKALGVFEKTYFIISSDHVRTLCACERGPGRSVADGRLSVFRATILGITEFHPTSFYCMTTRQESRV